MTLLITFDGILAATRLKEQAGLFFIFPPRSRFPYPSFPIPQHPYPLLHSPRPPRICRGSANERSTAVFLPRDKNLKVWCNPSLCLSCCFTPIRCAAPNDSASWSYRIGTLCGFVVTTPGHDNCLPGKAMCMFKKKKNTKNVCFSSYRVKNEPYFIHFL